MAAKKRITKKQMKEDALVTATFQFSHFMSEHMNVVLGGAFVLIVVIGAVLWVGKSRRDSLGKAENMFLEGMSRYTAQQFTVATDYFERVASSQGGSSVGARAQYFLGNSYLMSDQYERAVEAFDAYLKKPKRFPLYERAALSGKATALEDLERYAEAAEIYLGLVEGASNRFEEKDWLWAAARCFARAGKKAEAGETYARLEELADPFELAQIQAERTSISP